MILEGLFIAESLRAQRTLFYRQEKSFQDLSGKRQTSCCYRRVRGCAADASRLIPVLRGHGGLLRGGLPRRRGGLLRGGLPRRRGGLPRGGLPRVGSRVGAAGSCVAPVAVIWRRSPGWPRFPARRRRRR